MRCLRQFVCLAVGFWIGASCLEAQVAPVRIKVTRKQTYQQERSTETWVDAYTGQNRGTARSSVKYNRNGVCCLIEVSNSGNKPLSNLRVQWTLILDRRDKPPEVSQGEKACSIEVGRTFSMKTDIMPLSNTGAKDVGYCVEVFQDDQVIASSVDPVHVKELIDQWKAEKEKSGQRQR